ncbi:hypothetical protein ABZZ80_00920 [Streptomyces sp. NPDC006356]
MALLLPPHAGAEPALRSRVTKDAAYWPHLDRLRQRHNDST